MVSCQADCYSEDYDPHRGEYVKYNFCSLFDKIKNKCYYDVKEEKEKK